MEIKAFYPDPDDIPVTIQATMTAGQWKSIRLALETGDSKFQTPVRSFLQAIISANFKLNQYTQPDTQDA